MSQFISVQGGAPAICEFVYKGYAVRISTHHNTMRVYIPRRVEDADLEFKTAEDAIIFIDTNLVI